MFCPWKTKQLHWVAVSKQGKRAFVDEGAADQKLVKELKKKEIADPAAAVAIVNFLCENGGDLDNHLLFKMNKRMRTALHLAVRFGYDGIVAAILNHAQRIGGTKRLLEHQRAGGLLAVHDAARMGRQTIVELLCSPDTQVGVKTLLKPDDDGWTPLFWALAGGKSISSRKEMDSSRLLGRKQTVEAILKYGTSKEDTEANDRLLLKHAITTDKYGITPLQLACTTNDIDLVNLFVGQDADAVMQGLKQQTTSAPPSHISWATNGMSSLLFAARAGALRVLKVLCEEYHLDLFTCDAENRTAVHHASLFGNINVLDFFVHQSKMAGALGSVSGEPHASAGAMHKLLLMKDKDERTCLHLACDPTCHEADGATPQIISENSDETKGEFGPFRAVVARLCEVGGAHLWSQKDKDGRTALHLCALGGYVDPCKILLEWGGLELLNETDKEGKTCLDLATAKSKNEDDGRCSRVLKCLMADTSRCGLGNVTSDPK